MKSILTRLALMLFLLSPCLVEVRGQSVYEEFTSHYDATMNQRMAKYSPGGSTMNTFMKHWTIFSKSGGPIMSGMGMSLGKIINNGSWFWGLMLTFMGSISAATIWANANKGGGGANIIAEYVKLGYKMLVLLFVVAVPQFFYAAAMTTKDSFAMMASYAMSSEKMAVSGNSDPTIVETLNLSSKAGPSMANLSSVVGEATQKGFNQYTLALAEPELAPGTMQIYNVLAKRLNTLIAQTPEIRTRPFAIAEFAVGRSSAEAGKQYGPGDAFDGDYTDVSGYLPLASVPKKSIPTDKLDKFDYIFGSNWNAILTGDFPRMIQFLIILGYRDDVFTAMQSSAGDASYPGTTPVRPYVPRITLGGADIENKIRDLIRKVINAEITPQEAFKIPDSSATAASDLFIRYDAASRLRAFVTEEQLNAMLAKIGEQITKQASAFVRLNFAEQLKNHNKPRIANSSLEAMVMNGSRAQMDSRRDENSGVVASWIKSVANFIVAPIRKIVIFFCDTWFDFMIEASVISIWIASPMWLFDKTSGAFGGALNTLFTSSMLAPTLAALLTIWDGFTSLFVNAIMPPVTGSLMGLPLNLLAITHAPEVLIVVIVMNIVGVVLCALLTPKVAKGFFSGGNAVGAMIGGALAAGVGAADLAARVAPPGIGLAARAAMSGGKALAGAAANKFNSWGPGHEGEGASSGMSGGAEDEPRGNRPSREGVEASGINNSGATAAQTGISRKVDAANGKDSNLAQSMANAARGEGSNSNDLSGPPTAEEDAYNRAYGESGVVPGAPAMPQAGSSFNGDQIGSTPSVSQSMPDPLPTGPATSSGPIQDGGISAQKAPPRTWRSSAYNYGSKAISAGQRVRSALSTAGSIASNSMVGKVATGIAKSQVKRVGVITTEAAKSLKYQLAGGGSADGYIRARAGQHLFKQDPKKRQDGYEGENNARDLRKEADYSVN